MKPSFKFECWSILAAAASIAGLVLGVSDQLFVPTMLVISFVCIGAASILREMRR